MRISHLSNESSYSLTIVFAICAAFVLAGLTLDLNGFTVVHKSVIENEKLKEVTFDDSTTTTTTSTPVSPSSTSSTTSERPFQNEIVTNDGSCLSFDNDIDTLVAEASHIFIIMPNKAAGSSVKNFVGQCEKNHTDGLLRYDTIFKENALSHSMEMPTMIADHVEMEKHLLHTIEHSPSSALIIYIYREESDREASAIQHVAQSRLCNKKNFAPKPVPAVPIHYDEDGSCIIGDEDQFIESVIKARFWEIGYGVYDTLTCKTYKAIENEGPNMIMVNYKQADRLLQVLSKYRCPELEDKLFRNNVGSTKKIEAMMKLRSGQTVSVKDWVTSKKGQFGLFLPFHDDYKPQCKAKTRKLEKEMLRCEDEAIGLGGLAV